MSKPLFISASYLASLIDAYFTYIEGEYYTDKTAIKETGTKTAEQKIWCRDPEPPTISGLVLFLGFSSRQAFDEYEQNGKYASVLKRGRLRIEAAYEKKLHHQSPTGAIFVLKSMGWNDKPENKTTASSTLKTIKIEIIETGPLLAGNEKEVVL